MTQAEDFKAEGNKAFSAGNFQAAIDAFTKAIELDPTNHVLYSNRSAAYASLHQYEEAVTDAQKTIDIKPDWAKGYSRKGAALHGLGDLINATNAYQEGLKLEPDNAQLKKGLKDVEAAIVSDSKRNNPIAKTFGADMWDKIASNPKLAPMLAEPDVVQKLKEIERDPDSINKHLLDPRMIDIMMGLMGIEGSAADVDRMAEKQAESIREAQRSRGTTKPAAKAEPAPAPAPAPAPEPVPMDTEEDEKKKKRAASDAEKAKGNELYKKRAFDEALKHYEAAWELDNTNVAILTNKAAVLFEMEKYEECIKVCEDAVETGREQRVDYKLIARALGRAGSSYAKLNDFANAIKYYNKSLAEHRTPDILEKLRETERQQKQQEEQSYINPALSDEAREKGNELFKDQKYAEAVKLYSEAIKRNPEDARNYSNRAACYTKLMALPEADKDVNEAIRLDPNYMKAYVRKAAILFARREFTKSIELCEEMMNKETTDAKTKSEFSAQIIKANQALADLHHPSNRAETIARAKANPAVQAIMSDPIMQSILTEMKNDPKSIRGHMQNPMIADKIHTLINAGVVSF
eukprot:jgi/Hompol1/4498/HPOL_001786-RA